MARYSGKVGFTIEEEKAPGVYKKVAREVLMRGNLITASTSFQNSGTVNSDITIGHRISVLGDRFAFSNWHSITYAYLDGVKWRVTSVEIQRPRLLLQLGGPYNG